MSPDWDDSIRLVYDDPSIVGVRIGPGRLSADEVLENPLASFKDAVQRAAALAFGPPLILVLGFVLWRFRRKLTGQGREPLLRPAPL